MWLVLVPMHIKMKISFQMVLGVKKVIGCLLEDMLVLVLKLKVAEPRILNDDEIIATISDPRDIMVI